MDDGTKAQYSPDSEIELQMILTAPLWGTDAVDEDFRDKLKVKRMDDAGEEVDHDLWKSLSFFTQDNRLSFLDKEELRYVRHYLNLCVSCLDYGYTRAFLISMGEVASLTESAQSKGGWLRKRHGTISTESTQSQKQEIKRPSLFSMKKDKNGGL